MRPVSIIEFPFNLGLKEPSPGHEPGVRKLPEWLRQHHFHALIAPQETLRLEAPPYQMEPDPVQAVLNTDEIVKYANKQAGILCPLLSADKFPLAIGGDCSIVIGIALALKTTGNYAMFYLDGHTDFMEPALSGTKGVAGMPAAIVAGRGHYKLVNILEQGPYIKEQFVYCIGNREYDNDYENEIRFSDATYTSLAMLREQGIATVVDSFLKMVTEHRLDGFWLHIDVDVLDDALMPAVDSRTAGGLSYAEFNEALSLLLASPLIAGLDITILDPELDPTGQYTIDFVHNFTTTFNTVQITK